MRICYIRGWELTIDSWNRAAYIENPVETSTTPSFHTGDLRINTDYKLHWKNHISLQLLKKQERTELLICPNFFAQKCATLPLYTLRLRNPDLTYNRVTENTWHYFNQQSSWRLQKFALKLVLHVTLEEKKKHLLMHVQHFFKELHVISMHDLPKLPGHIDASISSRCPPNRL